MPAPIVSKAGKPWSGPGAISICLWCKTEIRHKPSQRRKYCSKPCRIAGEHQFSREINSRPCVVCGAMVYRPPSHHKRTPKHLFCSHACHGKWNRGKNNPAYTGSREATCAFCKRAFRKRQQEHKCCSIKCAGALIRAETHERWQADRICPQCSAPFVAQTKIQRYCTRKCADIAHTHRMAGAGNGRYVHGEALRKYPPGWTRTHKAQIRARDGQSCQCCGRGREPHRDLDVHHIDYDKANLDPSNLITLCRFCHGKMHDNKRSRAAWKRKLSALLRESGEKTLFTISASPPATTTSRRAA